jgi:hypothetical protein
MLMLVALAVYTSVVSGPTGTRKLVTEGGSRINDTIQAMDP